MHAQEHTSFWRGTVRGHAAKRRHRTGSVSPQLSFLPLSAILFSPSQDRTEEGEAPASRRYEPERDLLLQLLLEQRAADPLDAWLGSAHEAASDCDPIASMSLGQVPRPSPRPRRTGDFSASTTIK